MASLASVFPILPGKTEQWKHFSQTSRKRLGVTREVAYLQQTPQGDMAVVYMEAQDIAAMLQGLGSSQEPFDVWFREQVKDIHGVDLAQPPAGPLPEAIVDWRAS